MTFGVRLGVTTALFFPNEDTTKGGRRSVSTSAEWPHIRERDMRCWLAVAIGILAPTLAAAQPAARPVVGELFTSEGCSSCPPADAKVAELARTRPDLLLLTFHVTYWNYLGWRDPYSLDAATQRQRRYVALGVSSEVYTPALIVDGKLDVVGSDAAAVDRTLRQAAQSEETTASIDVRRGAAGVTVLVGAGTGNGTLLLIGYDPLHQEHHPHSGLRMRSPREFIQCQSQPAPCPV